MESAMKNIDTPAWFFSYATIRSDCYVTLASLLTQPPSKDLLDILQSLQWDQALPENMDEALGALRQASCDHSLASVQDEFDKLFIGLGSGEIVPYASWYRERMIQSFPLAALRTDLIRLGIVRQTESHESEDHAGALCEIMALICREQDGVPYATQAGFFQQHIASWMTAFFSDLRSAKSARFYRVVGLFGSRFLECEDEYLSIGHIGLMRPIRKGEAPKIDKEVAG
jgi:TorA maturation chaperone TorD